MALSSVRKMRIQHLNQARRSPVGRLRGVSPDVLEGAFYIWDKAELDEVTGDDALVIGHLFGVKKDGNVSAQHDMHGEMTGKVRECI